MPDFDPYRLLSRDQRKRFARGLPRIQTAEPAKAAAINFAKARTKAIVDVLIVMSDGEWNHEQFVSTAVDDYRYLAAWLVAAAMYGERDRRNSGQFDALVLYVVSHMDQLIGVPWYEPRP